MLARKLSLLFALFLGVAVSAPTIAADSQESIEGSCAVSRVRKDVKEMTSQEKQDFVGAVRAMKAMPSPYDSRYTYYDQFVRWHQMAVVVSSEEDGVGIAHHNPAFAPWHRKLLWLYENALCEASGDPFISLPYWDWTDPASTSAVFSSDLMGPGGDRSEAYAVTEGPFDRDTWQLNILPFDETLRARTPEKYLVRGMGVDTANVYEIVLPTIVDVNETLAMTTYDAEPWGVNSNDSFRNSLEGFVIDPTTGRVDSDIEAMHNIVHDWVGGVFYLATGTGELVRRQGTMEPLDVSPNDPIFFLHHANVDRIWASWQVANPGPENYLPQGGEPVCPYPLADDAGPDDPVPQVSDAELKAKNAAHIDDAPWPGMRLNDWMYPYCLERYDGTAVHDDLSPADFIELGPLGYTYADLHTVPALD